MYTHLGAAPPDPILGLASLLAADPAPDKVDLGIGVYKDEHGAAPVLDCVKTAERLLVENQKTKQYLSSAGNPDFNRLTRELILGRGTKRLARSAAIQCPGGTGAIRSALDFVRKATPDARVFIPNPTWANHTALCKAAGLEPVPYDYYDKTKGALVFDRMLQTLSGMRENDVLILHGCCHNPSGADLSEAQVREVIELLLKRAALPLIDLAYLGFGSGIHSDAAVLRQIVDAVPTAIIASSNSKNFALYRDRVAALIVVGEGAAEAERIKGHLLPVVRSNYSMPPDHGAAVVAEVLGDQELSRLWERELSAMRSRVNRMRVLFSNHMTDISGKDYSWLASHKGMFALLRIQADEVRRLRQEYHVHITGSGRLNIAGLTEGNVERVAEALSRILH